MLSINANDLKLNGIVGIKCAMSDSHDSSLIVKAKYVVC